MNHTHKWIKSLMDGLDNQVDEQTRTAILENCGRNCIPRSFIDRVKAQCKNTEDLDALLDDMGQIWSHVHKEGDHLSVVYDKCYCPLVKAYPDKLSPSFCTCSRGWVKELFESVMGRPVEVQLEQSVRQGDPICKFSVRL
jgi:predicted hydrocarbon binding protein